MTAAAVAAPFHIDSAPRRVTMSGMAGTIDNDTALAIRSRSSPRSLPMPSAVATVM